MRVVVAVLALCALAAAGAARRPEDTRYVVEIYRQSPDSALAKDAAGWVGGLEADGLAADFDQVDVLAASGSKFTCLLPRIRHAELPQDSLPEGETSADKSSDEVSSDSTQVDASGPKGSASEEVVESEESKQARLEKFSAKWNDRIKKQMGKLCFVKNAGYWTYEVCPLQEATQFHRDPGSRDKHPLIKLGDYDAESSLASTLESLKLSSASAETPLSDFIPVDLTRVKVYPAFTMKFIGGDGGRVVTGIVQCPSWAIQRKPMPDNWRESLTVVEEPIALQYKVIIESIAGCAVPDGSTFKFLSLDPTSGRAVISDNSPELPQSPEGKALRLLSDLEGQCLILPNGWWTYKFCYKQEVVQYHQEHVQIEAKGRGEVSYETVVTAKFVLGSFSGLESDFGTITNNTNDPSLSYYSQVYKDGSPCDLTNIPRSTEVRFKCNEDAATTRILSIQETQTCQYLMLVETNLLCSHPAFFIEKPPVAPIQCFLSEPASSTGNALYKKDNMRALFKAIDDDWHFFN